MGRREYGLTIARWAAVAAATAVGGGIAGYILRGTGAEAKTVTQTREKTITSLVDRYIDGSTTYTTTQTVTETHSVPYTVTRKETKTLTTTRTVTPGIGEASVGIVRSDDVQDAVKKAIELAGGLTGLEPGMTVMNNRLDSNEIGICIQIADSNTLISNTLNSNDVGIWVDDSRNNILTRNYVSSSEEYGIRLVGSGGNIIYDNYFDNTNNARDDGENIWNIDKAPGTNVVGGHFIGGNFWSDYAGADKDRDGLGNSLLPYDSYGGIVYGGDFQPLVPVD